MEKVITAMRKRAKAHRQYGLLYTIAIFVTIFAAIGAYYLFMHSRLNDLEASNLKLRDEYKNVLTGMNGASARIKTSLNSTENVLKEFYDSLRRQTEATHTLSSALAEKVASIENAVDLASMQTTKNKFDSLADDLQALVLETRTRVADVRDLEFEIARILPYYSTGSRLYEIDSLQKERTRQILDTVIIQLERERPGSILRSNNFNDYFALQTKRHQDNLRAVGRAIDHINNNIKQNRNLLINYSTAIANIKNITSKSTSSEVNEIVKQIQSLRPGINSNIILVNNLRNALRELETTAIEVDQSETNPLAVLKRLNATIQQGIADANKVEQQFGNFSQAIIDNDEKANDFYGNLPELLARYGLIIFLIYVIQITLSYAKYHYKLASFYDSKSDALELRSDLSDISTIDLIKLLDSSSFGFGKAENIYKTLYDEAKQFKDNGYTGNGRRSSKQKQDGHG